MDRWYSRYRRGDVWFLHFDAETGDGSKTSSVQKKSRPYLIVSCEENNLNAPTFNVVPITTRDSDHLPMHIYFRYMDGHEGGRNQLVLCEQITTVSVETFLDPKSWFMYSFSIEFMNKVDEALTRQLGLKPRVADMQVLERIVHELANAEMKKIQLEKDKEVNMRVEALAEFLIKKFNLSLTTTALLNGTEYRDEELQCADKQEVQKMRETAKERTTPEVAKKQAKSEKTVRTQSTLSKPDGKSRRRTWSLEEKKQFLRDYDTLTTMQMSDKYNIKKSTIAYNACVFRKEVGKGESGGTFQK